MDALTTSGTRPASTVVLMRDASAGPEVLVVARGTCGAVPGMFAFPGGVVESADGPMTDEAGSGYRMAACRETFEETGLLLTRDAPPGMDLLRRARQDLLACRMGFDAVLASLGVRPALSELTYFARWITPLALPKRFDTRFFLMCAPAAEAEPDGIEIVDVRWTTPAAALAGANAGSIPMVNATMKTLEWLVRFGSVDEARAGLGSTNIDAILPKAKRQGEGFHIVNPWEAGYADI